MIADYIAELEDVVETTICGNIGECTRLIREFGFGNDLFKLFHTNIRSVAKNYSELQVLISLLDQDFDIIVLTETFCVVDLNLYKLSVYSCYYNNSSLNKNDGVIVYVKTNLEHKIEIQQYPQSNIFRISVKLNNYCNVVVNAIYKTHTVCCNDFYFPITRMYEVH